jgi:hypothetical protein
MVCNLSQVSYPRVITTLEAPLRAHSACCVPNDIVGLAGSPAIALPAKEKTTAAHKKSILKKNFTVFIPLIPPALFIIAYPQ